MAKRIVAALVFLVGLAAWCQWIAFLYDRMDEIGAGLMFAGMMAPPILLMAAFAPQEFYESETKDRP